MERVEPYVVTGRSMRMTVIEPSTRWGFGRRRRSFPKVGTDTTGCQTRGAYVMVVAAYTEILI